MNLKSIVFLFLVVALPHLANAQLIPIDSVTVDAHEMEIDELGKIYLLKVDALELRTPDLKFLYQTGNGKLTTETQLDVSKSLKPLLFYPEYNIISLLDNTLSGQGSETTLPWDEFGQVSQVCHSIGHHYWFFDQLSMKLYRVDYGLKIVTATPDLSAVLGVSMNPTDMVEVQDKLYMVDPEHGVYVFDIYGSYVTTLKFTGYTSIQAFSDRIFLFNGNHILKYNLTTKQQELFELPYSNVRDISIHGGNFYVLTPGKLIKIKYRHSAN
ncbi:MAG: hypothetical protein KDC12_05525 [Flavobacteriales bacterium]|nr:hypothetical protein [Flavobacteriales bacterium]